jgi:hypothetical protein
MLHCAACGNRLTGDTGYYRDREPCAAFVAASVGAGTITRVVDEVSRAAAPDRTVLDRIARERERAMARYLRDRDAAHLDQTMTHLDGEQAAAATTTESVDVIPADVAVRYVRNLPETWRRADGGQGRRLLASSLFERVDVLGIQEATFHLSAHAVRHGLAGALPREVGILVNGRGERSRTSTTDLNVPVRLPLVIEVTGVERWLRGSTA